MRKRRYNQGMSPTDRFANAVNDRRDAGHLQLKEIAEKTGIHVVQLSRMLSRTQQTISLDDAVAIADVTGLSIDAICKLEKNLLSSV